MPSWAEEVKELKAQLSRTKRRLHQIAERYVLATAAASVGVWDWNLETGTFYLDSNIKAFLGYRDDEIPNDLEVWAQYIHPDDNEAVMNAAQQAIDGHTPEYVFEHRMLHKNGSVRWFMVRGKVIRDEQGRPIRFVGTDTDITERRNLEHKVRELSNEIETRIGHDLHDTLGQQLTGVLLKLRRLESEAADKYSHFAERVREAKDMAEHAIELTEAFSRGLSPVLNPGGLVQGLNRLADDAQQLYGIEVRVELQEDLPEDLSRLSGNELYRIAQEAVTSAVRHGNATRIEINGSILHDRLLLSIVDNGSRTAGSERDITQRGIGIMQYRARHLGGSVTVSRRRDGGTRIVCSCPIPRQ